MLAFPSCWNNSRHTDDEAMIEEILGLGFGNISTLADQKINPKGLIRIMSITRLREWM